MLTHVLESEKDMVKQQHLLRLFVVLTLGGKQKGKWAMYKGNGVGQPCFITTY